MKEMVDTILAMFNNFLRSNKTLQLDDSFSVYLKVLSTAHVNFPNHRRTGRGRRTYYGCKTDHYTRYVRSGTSNYFYNSFMSYSQLEVYKYVYYI